MENVGSCMDTERATPGWLREGASLSGPEGERWVIRRIGPSFVWIGHPERGEHKLRRADLLEWVESGDWDPGV